MIRCGNLLTLTLTLTLTLILTTHDIKLLHHVAHGDVDHLNLAQDTLRKRHSVRDERRDLRRWNPVELRSGDPRVARPTEVAGVQTKRGSAGSGSAGSGSAGLLGWKVLVSSRIVTSDLPRSGTLAGTLPSDLPLNVRKPRA